jgi:glycosyltransferase involved in cell wall biosynthesis
MKLAFFDFNINFGGAPQGSVSLARRLAENCEVHIIDAYGSCEDYCLAVQQAGLPLHIICPEAKRVCIGNNGNYALRFFSIICQLFNFWKIRHRLLRTLKKIQPDLIWVNNEKSLVFLLGPILRVSFNVIYYVRGWGTQDQIGLLLRFLLKRRVKYILAHARASIEQLKLIGIPEEKVFYIPNAVEIVINPLKARQNHFDLPGMDKQLKILLPAARPVREKGHVTAVKALRRLVDSGLDPVLWFPGKVAVGVEYDFLSELSTLIKDLALEDRVHFIGWRKDLQLVMVNSDVVVLPSHTEGFPRVIIEAMLLGVPVCATPIGGIPEAIDDGLTGFIIEIDDDLMLAERIASLARDNKLRDSMVQRAYSKASEAFALEKQTRIVLDIFRKAIGHVSG